MAKWIARVERTRLLLAGASIFAGAAAVALVGLAPVAMAQQKGKSAGKAAPAAQQSAWVKLCESAKYQKMGADGKPQFGPDKKPLLEDKKLCLTHHEQMTSAGVTLVSAAVQQLEGVEKLGLMVMVPAAVGLTIPTGMKVIVYDKDQWAKAQKKEKLDESKLVAQNLVFTMCHQNGCTAENEATPQLVEAMKKGTVMVALAIHVSGRPVSFQVPLNGFAGTIGGKPVDNALYKQQREKLWQQIRGNQLAQIKKYQEQLQKPAPVAGGPGPAKK